MAKKVSKKIALGRIDACYDYRTKFGKALAKITACFQGKSTYGDGKATFRAYDKDGNYMPHHSWASEISWSDFFDRMDRFKAKRVSGLNNVGVASMRTKKRCMTINKQPICEGDYLIQKIKDKTVKHKVEGICGAYTIVSGWEGISTHRIEELKKRLTGAKYEIKRLGNPPFSPYHHKTGMPGVPGQHRLTGFDKRLAKAMRLI